ncbi:hypothetical protein HOF17_02380 [Candidatus Peribacteria bacterium]|nr:hypothetical protein [Candidatus Peribacteria bacterium]
MKNTAVSIFLFMFFATPVAFAEDSGVSENLLSDITIQEEPTTSSVTGSNEMTDPATVGGPIFDIKDLRAKRMKMRKNRMRKMYEYGIERSDTGEDNHIVPDVVNENGRPMHRLRGSVRAGMKEVRSARNDFRKERRSSLKEFMNEKKSERKDFMKKKKEDIRTFRQGGMNLDEFKAEREGARKSFRIERKSVREDFREGRRDNRQEFKSEIQNAIGEFRGVFQKTRLRLWRTETNSIEDVPVPILEDVDSSDEEDDPTSFVEDELRGAGEDEEDEDYEMEFQSDGTQSFFGSMFEEKIRKSNGRTGRGEMRGDLETKRTRMGN